MFRLTGPLGEKGPMAVVARRSQALHQRRPSEFIPGNFSLPAAAVIIELIAQHWHDAD